MTAVAPGAYADLEVPSRKAAVTELPRHNRTPALIGREDVLTVLQRLCDSGAANGGALLLIGPPGVGKTALLDAAAALAGNGVRVVRAAGVEFETDVSFAGLNQVLLPLIDHLPDLTDHHNAALQVALGLRDGSPAGRLIVAAAALALLRSAAADQPLMLVIDDLPWLDRPSAQVLGFIARRLADTKVTLLAALRTNEPSFFEQAGIPTLPVHPLDADASTRLVRSAFPAVADRVRDRLVTESQGIPLALLELPRELNDAQQSGDEPLPVTMRLGRELHTIFAARVATLSEPTRRLLLLAALDGSGDLRILRSDDDTGQSDRLGPAEQARLVVVDANSHRLNFLHPLIRSAVVALATAAEQRAAHRTLADLFEDDLDLRVHHLAEATTHPDEDVALDLERAAYRVLRRGDPVAAVTTLLRSAELSTTGAVRARRLTEAAWIGADVTGALGDVGPLVTQARRADPHPESSLATSVLAAFVLLNGDGDVDTAHRLLVSALQTTAPGSVPGHVIDEAIHTLMMVCFVGDRAELWPPFEAALQRFSADLSRIQVLAATTFADPQRSDPDTLAELDQIIAGLHEENDPAQIVRVAIAANFVGRINGCRNALLRVVADGRAGGAVASAVTALLMLTDEEILAGHWPDARRLAEEGIALCDDYGYPLLAWPGRYALALLAAATGGDERCRGLVDEMLQWSTPRGARIVATYSRHTAGIAALGRGDWQDAFALLASVNPPGAFGSREAYALWTVLDLVEAAVRSGHTEAATVHLATATTANLAAISPRQAYLCAGAAAMVADDEHAADLFDAAAAMVEPHQWPFERARLELAHGERLRRLHSVTAARVHLATALELFDRLGARPWAARVRIELEATGQHRRTGSDVRTGLTPQEHQIAQLAATGMTNRQIGERLFLSPRTVSAHLYRTFPKLRVTSRAGLRDALDAVMPEAPARRWSSD
jgi:DNA-binding CsgD family transcriptional regulator